MKTGLGFRLLTLFLAALACRPVIAIGWNEFLLLFLLIALLLGPPVFKFMQRVSDFLKQEKKKKK